MITAESTLKDALELPGGEEALVKNHVPCPSCPFAAQEMGKLNLGQIARTYGLDLDQILKDLNNPK